MLYNFAIVVYDFFVHLVAPFSRKPRKMMKGHWVVYELLRQQLEKEKRYIWFHAASLGEFEQGRPLVSRMPNIRIMAFCLPFSLPQVMKSVRITEVPMSFAICLSINLAM